MRAHLGIDGGGTGCRGRLIAGGAVREARGGPANIDADPAGTLSNLRALLTELAPPPGCALHLGLAGIITETPDLRAALDWEGPLSVSDDQVTSLRGALAGDGHLLSVGTGSFAGRVRDGAITLIGGWGLELGDQASGGWLAREALSRACLAQDGIVPQDALTAAVVARFGPVPGRWLALPRGEKSRLAALVPEIVDLPEVAPLLAEGAAYLGRALAALDWQGGPVCLTGGLADVYAPRLSPEVRAALVPARGSALDGAVALAKELLE